MKPHFLYYWDGANMAAIVADVRLNRSIRHYGVANNLPPDAPRVQPSTILPAVWAEWANIPSGPTYRITRVQFRQFKTRDIYPPRAAGRAD